jgi:hypothetical protein
MEKRHVARGAGVDECNVAAEPEWIVMGKASAPRHVARRQVQLAALLKADREQLSGIGRWDHFHHVGSDADQPAQKAGFVFATPAGRLCPVHRLREVPQFRELLRPVPQETGSGFSR